MREVVRVRSAAEMHAAVHVARRRDATSSSWPPPSPTTRRSSRAEQKVAKDGDSLTLVLKKTPDILGDLGRRRLAQGEGPLLVGFAAETENVVARATAKRERKHVDLIVANDVSRTDAGFDVDTNAVTIVGRRRRGAAAAPGQVARRRRDPRPGRKAADSGGGA